MIVKATPQGGSKEKQGKLFLLEAYAFNSRYYDRNILMRNRKDVQNKPSSTVMYTFRMPIYSSA